MAVKNIMFIAVDDCFSFRKFRNSFGVPIQTPNLDALAAKGTVFDRAYCEIAVCEPSRYAVMSGRSPFQSGIFNSEEMWTDGAMRPDQMWSYRLKQAGFYCRTGGKIYHGYTPQPAEVNRILYDEVDAISFGQGGADAPYKTYSGSGGNKGFTDTSRDGDFYDAKSATKAIQFLGRASTSKPWYCEVGFHHPHTGFDTPDRFKAQYDEAAVRVPAEWAGGFEATEFSKGFIEGTYNIDTPFDGPEWRGTIRNYFSAISHVDYEIGRLLTALEASPHAAETMVVFYSDHGYHLGDHGRMHKFTLWEVAALAPLIIYVPGQTPRVVTQPVSFMDIGQTVLDYAGLPLMDHCPGISLRPYIEGTATPSRWVPTFWYGCASATNGDYRLVMYQDASVEFYDVANDPFCRINLGRAHAQFPAARDALLAACRQHGYRLVEQGMDAASAVDGAEWRGYMGDFTDAEAAQGSWSSIGAMTPWGESPGYRRQMMSMTGANTDLRIGQGVEWVNVQSRTGGNYTLTGHMGDKQIRLIALLGGASATVNLIGGDNFLYGEGHAMRAYGGPGRDTVQGDSQADWIDGAAGDDSLMGGNGNDTILGGGGNDAIIGGGGNDTIDGGAGADSLTGGDGNDRIVMWGGDVAAGGNGTDRFVVMRSEQPQTISDLTTGDVIDLSDWALIQPATVTQSGTAVIVTAGMEQLTCAATTVAAVRAAITGATYV